MLVLHGKAFAVNLAPSCLRCSTVVFALKGGAEEKPALASTARLVSGLVVGSAGKTFPLDSAHGDG